MNDSAAKPLAIVTGASTGIGYELARCCVEEGFDLVIAADQPEIESAARDFRGMGAEVIAVQVDLATLGGVDALVDAANALNRPVDALLANAGHGLGKGFLDQDFSEARHVIDTNITGTIYLIQKIGREMRGRGEGRILITGSIGASCRAVSRRSITGLRHSSARSHSRSATSSRTPA
jgi:short-subunit dehydrogenase